MRDIFDDDQDSKNSSDFAKMFENSMTSVGQKLNIGDKIRGEVLTVGKEEVFVSTGTMDDGIVLKIDLIDDKGQTDVKVGDFLDLYVTKVSTGQILLSPKPTSKNLSDDLEDAFDMELPVEGRVTEVVNGGFRVSLLGKTAFCPISQMDSRRIEDSTSYIDKKFEFLITKFDSRGKNIVVSRRKLLDSQKEASTAAFAEDHKPGDMLRGVVTRLESFGAFVEIAPGLEGLCHISEISYSRLGHPSEGVKIGQEVDVKILKLEEGMNGRLNVSLSIKQAAPTPWENFPSNIREGAIVEGRVTRCMKFGAFVQVAPGIEGLVPLSEMSFEKRITRAEEVVNEGDRVNVRVKEIRKDEQRLLLSIKDADEGRFEEERETREFVSKSSSSKSMGTLGEQFKGLFDAKNSKK